MEWNNNSERKRDKFCKSIFTNTCYFILFLLVIMMFVSFISDVYKKWDQELYKLKQDMEKCEYEWNLNKCWKPVDQVRDYCEKMTACKDQDPNKTIKISNVLSRLVKETLNDMVTGVSWQGCGVIAATVLICACCCGKCSMGRG